MKSLLYADGSMPLFAATACNGTTNEAGGDDEFKIGIILLHNETVGYDKNFIDAIEAAADELGLKDSQIIYKKDIPEDSKCYDACVELAEEGCVVIFADSFSHEAFVIQAAKEYPNIQFLHATGQNAVTRICLISTLLLRISIKPDILPA